MKQVLCRVISQELIMPGVSLAWFESPDIAQSAKPGQFVMIKCGEENFLRRPLSVHQVDGDKIALLFAIAGKGTHWLWQRQPGDTVDIFGPMGNGFTLPDTSQKISLIAGGIGIAPLRFLADVAVKQEKEVILFMGARNSSGLLPNELLPAGIKTVRTTEDGSAGFQGIVTAAWTNFHLEFEGFKDYKDIFACGPFPMYQAMTELTEFEDKNVQISLEIMMGCGVGVCYGCTIRTKSGLKQVCRDGPVFELKDIIRDETGAGLG